MAQHTVAHPVGSEWVLPVVVSQNVSLPSASPITTDLPQATRALAAMSMGCMSPAEGRLARVSATLRPCTLSTPARPSPSVNAMNSSGY